MSGSSLMEFEPTRSAGLKRLEEFLPHAGRAYTNIRNHDEGAPDAGWRRGVSQLSPWLHTGLLSEAEVIAAVLRAHSFDAAEKFVAEVFWRIYFKGYLQQRPVIWRSYVSNRDAALHDIETGAGRSADYVQAISGETGIAAFDHWARELVSTGYLHNHARMWFASIWIFTLRLDWHLGADFFLRHLVDGDAASNTLSWRWVGGLHTKGKTYLARADNIARYTANRPGGPLTAEGLAQTAAPLENEQEFVREPLALPPPPHAAAFAQPYALLLHDEAASHVPLTLPHPPALIIGAARTKARSSCPIGEIPNSFGVDAVKNGIAEAAAAFRCEVRDWHPGAALADILKQTGVDRIVLPHLAEGWTRDNLMPELAPMIARGEAVELMPELSRVTWPHAKAGFFGVNKMIPALLADAGIAGSASPPP
ncbi:FAD-binding domain-containing protein [Qipengyuania sp. ASV99]|uniref:FAD-binding domain-containing protein n=1 Tax=Qipengyuania sp. ASV99 TaxID=3399681 RepID=UPI003A4C655B